MYDCVKFDFSRIVMDLKTLVTQMDTRYFDISESYFRRQATKHRIRGLTSDGP